MRTEKYRLHNQNPEQRHNWHGSFDNGTVGVDTQTLVAKTGRRYERRARRMTVRFTMQRDKPSGTERTVSNGRLCANCATLIEGRRPQARFCSDRCRTAAHRREREERLRCRLEALEVAAGSLQAELRLATSTRSHHD